MQPAPYVKNLGWVGNEQVEGWGQLGRAFYSLCFYFCVSVDTFNHTHTSLCWLSLSLSLACTEGTHTHTVKLGLIQNRWETCVTCRFDPPPLHPQLTFSHTLAATITYTTLGPECYSAKINTEMRWLDPPPQFVRWTCLGTKTSLGSCSVWDDELERSYSSDAF